MGENEFGKWLGFETLTRTYLDTAPLILSLMDRCETEWLNNFNRTVFEELSPYLTPDEKEWLKYKTQSI
jgi:Xaa-Pro aminopeptidase